MKYSELEANYLEKKQPIDKLIADLKKQQIFFNLDDGIGNVSFMFKNKVKYISWDWFFRKNGIYSFRKMINTQEFDLEPMSDDMFYNSFVKAIVEYTFKYV